MDFLTGFLETSHTAEAEAEVGGYFLALELSAEYIRQNERGRDAIQALQGSDMFRGRYSWQKEGKLAIQRSEIWDKDSHKGDLAPRHGDDAINTFNDIGRGITWEVNHSFLKTKIIRPLAGWLLFLVEAYLYVLQKRPFQTKQKTVPAGLQTSEQGYIRDKAITDRVPTGALPRQSESQARGIIKAFKYIIQVKKS